MLRNIDLNRNVVLLISAGLLAALLLVVWPATSEAAGADEVVAAGLTVEETADLLFMREEEKLARDLYLAFYDQYGLPVFRNIAAAEQRHMGAVLTLMDRYELADPVGDNGRGVFNDPELAALYEQLLAEGSASLSEALRVGAAVEEIDILDLQESLSRTDRVDISRVFSNLLAGSVNHLRAYASLWARQTGQEYVPQYMSLEAYEVLLGEEIDGPGRGRGGRRGGWRRGGAGSGR